jgi:hypothetical protein
MMDSVNKETISRVSKKDAVVAHTKAIRTREVPL